jgi:hypothetical protein
MKLHLGDLPQERAEIPAPAGWHRIQSPGSRWAYLLALVVGFVFPNVLCLWLVVVSALVPGNGGTETPIDSGTPWLAALGAFLLCIPLHELLHASAHPHGGRTPQTTMIVWPAKLRFGVYYEGCMIRKRWLMMRLTPLLVLSVLPAVLLTLFYWVAVAYAVNVFLQVLMLVNAIGSGADIVAAAWVLFQVPALAQICFSGGKAYWQ